jgi:Ca2+-binding EF-hand superfamily protein
MRGLAAAVCVFLGVGGAGAAGQPPAGPVLLFPGAAGPVALRLEIVVDGVPPATDWERFLDSLFDFFDRDADGTLSRAEVSRMPPLPLPGGRELTIDFARLDADGDGKATRAELKSFCRTNGFTPVVVVVEPPSADDVRLADLFRRALGGGDGKVTRDTLRRAPRMLQKYDLNDDEFLEAAELLAGAPAGLRPGPAEVRPGGADAAAAAVLRLDVGSRARAVLDGAGANPLRLAAVPSPPGLWRWHEPEGRWSISTRARRLTPDVRSARDFLVAQFRGALGDRATLARADVEGDPALGGLQELFRFADRNGDDRLSLAALEAYFQLVERGVAAQVWVTVRDHGHNPLPFLDTDADGRLSYRETARAADLLTSAATEARDLPRQYGLSFGGAAAASWGGVPIPAAVRRPRTEQPGAPRPPAWFEAMDVNKDGVLTPREFLGPPEVFRKLDADGDGVISLEEAIRATSR